jgi:hypothetical protein
MQRIAELFVTALIYAVIGFRWLVEVPYEIVRSLFKGGK